MAPNRSLHIYTLWTAAFAAFVIFAGAMVTSTGSGMSVPDWPQSFGTWTPEMKGGVFYEHGHRLVAGLLGMLVLALSVWSASSETRRRARVLTWGALVAVLAQAALGGLTVLRGTFFDWGHTDPIVSAMHASLAQALLATLVAYATVSAPSWWDRRERLKASPALAAGSLALVAGIFLQIVLGAVMRHQQAGLIIYDFPLNYGHILPTFYSPLVALNFAHRVGGWLLATLGAGFAGRIAFDRGLDPWVRRPAALFLGAVLVQFLLGACVVWTHLTEPVLTSAHVVGGSVLLSTAVVLALRLRRLSMREA